eukprot:scaffold42202_cov55-Attheya_sp.AAC.3
MSMTDVLLISDRSGGVGRVRAHDFSEQLCEHPNHLPRRFRLSYRMVVGLYEERTFRHATSSVHVVSCS